MSVTLARLAAGRSIVDAKGAPAAALTQFWHNVCNLLESQQAQLDAQQKTINQILAGSTAVALITQANEWAEQQTFDVEPIAPGYKTGSPAHQVVGTQGASIAALAGAATLAQVITAYNTLLAEIKAHGLILP